MGQTGPRADAETCRLAPGKSGGAAATVHGRTTPPMATHERTAWLVAGSDGQRPAPAPGEIDPVLARPFRHQLAEGQGRLPDVAPKRYLSPPRLRQLDADAYQRDERSGHVDLARSGAKPPAASERELCPRSHGVVCAGRRTLQRKGRHRSRSRLHRFGPQSGAANLRIPSAAA